ncbi:major facilitator superfamily domain-containing protein [Aspergillus insuetus]
MGTNEVTTKTVADVVTDPLPEDVTSSAASGTHDSDTGKKAAPLLAKLFTVFLISCISFGSHWSTGVTGAMKSTIKKEMNINNTQFSLLEASEDFMATVLMLLSGIITDRVGGAGMMVAGNVVYTLGSILVAAATTVRSFNFMIGGRVILALGDIATQIAQYKMFSSWFAPSNGFASTLGFELAIGKIGGFVGKSTANVIAKNTGNFAWVFWTSVFMNLFTNLTTIVFYFYTRYCSAHYVSPRDTATKEELTDKNKRFEWKKMLQLPWTFWCILAFSLFQTSAALVFSQNATELAEQRFGVDSVKAGWYSALSQYAGFFLVPCLGVFIDVLGNRGSVISLCGLGTFLAMALVNFAPSKGGTAASFGVFAIASSLGPTSIIDSIRTSLWHQTVFGSAYALKITMNNAMNIIIRIITGALQDADDNSYRRAVQVYLFQGAAGLAIGLGILVGSFFAAELNLLQWTRWKRLSQGPEIIQGLKERNLVLNPRRTKRIAIMGFVCIMALTVGGWVAYIWGAVTGHNK